MFVPHEPDVCEMKARNIQEPYSSALKAVLLARNISVSQADCGEWNAILPMGTLMRSISASSCCQMKLRDAREISIAA